MPEDTSTIFPARTQPVSSAGAPVRARRSFKVYFWGIVVAALRCIDMREFDVGADLSARGSRIEGLDGCVASPREIRPLRNALGRPWVIVTPGIRPAVRDDDQVRTATPAAAVGAGADYLVVGRPITAAPDAVAAARAIVREISAAT